MHLIINRKCPFCLTHIEDETHFLINCPIYSSIRLKTNGIEEETCVYKKTESSSEDQYSEQTHTCL